MPNYQISKTSSKIGFIRSTLNLSMASLGEMIGYSGVHISRIEKGTCNVTTEFLDSLCQAVPVREEYFKEDVEVDDLERYLLGEGSGIKNLRNIDYSDAGRRLREVRTERGLNIKQLSELSGVDAGLISNIENHGKTLTVKQGIKLADALEVGMDWLMYGDEEKKEYPVDERMVRWLWDHEDARRKIREDMKSID